MKTYFVYKTLSKVSDRFYIGVHGTNNIDDGYVGTGNLVKAHQKKYGKDSVHVVERVFFDNADEAFELEAAIVTEELLADPRCMNLAVGGRGGEHFRQRKAYAKRKGVIPSAETKAKIALAKSTTSPETRAAMSESAKRRVVTLKCPHCGVSGKTPVINRWHFSNCKHKGVF